MGGGENTKKKKKKKKKKGGGGAFRCIHAFLAYILTLFDIN